MEAGMSSWEPPNKLAMAERIFAVRGLHKFFTPLGCTCQASRWHARPWYLYTSCGGSNYPIL